MPSMRKRSLLPTVCLNGSENGEREKKSARRRGRVLSENKLPLWKEVTIDSLYLTSHYKGGLKWHEL